MKPMIWIPRPKSIELKELSEPSRFGQNARRELIRWFPSSSWIARIDANPELCEQVHSGRREALLSIGVLTAAAAMPTMGCQALGVIFQLIDVAAKVVDIGAASGGSATFSNGSPSRESAQLITQLVHGSSENAYDDNSNLQDERELLADVPGNSENWIKLFDGLISEVGGDHFMAGISTGVTLFSKLFSYV
jgi:hypothetical protein